MRLKSLLLWPTVLAGATIERVNVLPESGVRHLLTRLLWVYCRGSARTGDDDDNNDGVATLADMEAKGPPESWATGTPWPVHDAASLLKPAVACMVLELLAVMVQARGEDGVNAAAAVLERAEAVAAQAGTIAAETDAEEAAEEEAAEEEPAHLAEAEAEVEHVQAVAEEEGDEDGDGDEDEATKQTRVMYNKMFSPAAANVIMDRLAAAKKAKGKSVATQPVSPSILEEALAMVGALRAGRGGGEGGEGDDDGSEGDALDALPPEGASTPAAPPSKETFTPLLDACHLNHPVGEGGVAGGGGASGGGGQGGRGGTVGGRAADTTASSGSESDSEGLDDLREQLYQGRLELQTQLLAREAQLWRKVRELDGVTPDPYRAGGHRRVRTHDSPTAGRVWVSYGEACPLVSRPGREGGASLSAGQPVMARRVPSGHNKPRWGRGLRRLKPSI
jgi:hypothetical protein